MAVKKPRRGRVERALRLKADDLGMTPKKLLQTLISEGVTQRQIAEELGCTRQAVSIMAERHGVGFPGARYDLDEAAKRVSEAKNFRQFVKMFWGEFTQKQMAEMLGTSSSTVKRRIRELVRAGKL